MRAPILVLMLACGTPSAVVQPEIVPLAEPHRDVAALTLQTEVGGLSGLTLDEFGRLWAIPEEERVLLELDPTTGAVTHWPIEGLDEPVELESLAALGEGRFVAGTEREGDGRSVDSLLYLRRTGAGYRVEDLVTCPYAQWELVAGDNRGIEGICAVGSELVVASEVVQERDGRRYAPIARRRADGTWMASTLQLTSDEGKIAGLTCRRTRGQQIEVLAIERHFGLLRLVEFRLGPDSELVAPSAVHSFDQWLAARDDEPNFEGIARLRDGRVVMVVDNWFHQQSQGDNSLFLVRSRL